MEQLQEEPIVIQEKGFSKVEELKKKINDERYIKFAINRMANDICEMFFQ